ncbi:OmpA family protein [Aerosakkonemataceae cyanobacterium BLCC-F154]|uniref:OmpA family protein n=1 Tax=Floridaenema fluviatile BLCC-F154 TaxID=3153640 RepID=A0ABV4YFK9_9CYAN
MSLFQENPAGMNQLEYFVPEPNHLNQETETDVEKLVNLLVDLNIMRSDKYDNELTTEHSNTTTLPSEISEEKIEIDKSNVENHREEKIEIDKLDVENRSEEKIEVDKLDVEKQEDLSTALLAAIEEQTQQIISLPVAIDKLEAAKPSASLLEYYDDNVEELYDAYKRLQVLLLEPELGDLDNLIKNLEQKLANIEQQIYEPQQLINLLLPIISELLSRKINDSQQSKESIINTITPIVHDLIKAKTQEDENSIASAISSAISPAIFLEARQDPEELATAIAPIIAQAIKKQIKLEPEAMIEALTPIIDRVIKNKREEDKEALIQAIAPLLPPAISQQIRSHPQEIAQAIAPELAAAIKEQNKLDENAISKALASEMGKAIKEQIAIERDAMVDALYPVIGSTISKYMADAIRSINEKIENTLSLEGINRKIRARMQGVSEAELILKEAIPFSIRAVFLIQKSSGLLIAETQPEDKEKLESDMVAGMLTAIRSFVNDCIARSGEVSEIDAIDYGNSKIILEVAGYCYLAVVTQGKTPQWYIRRIQRTLYKIVHVAGNEIENFAGDPDTIPRKVHEFLAKLIKIDGSDAKPHSFRPPGLLILASLLLGVIILPWGFFQYRYSLESRLEKETMQALASVPELAVYRLEARANNGKLQLSGKLPNQYLRSKAEEIVKKIAPDRLLENKIIAVEIPPSPAEIASEVKRVTSTLNKINGITVYSLYSNGKLTVKGRVSQVEDAEKITQAFKQIPGVKTVTNTVQVQPEAIAARIYFDSGSAELKATDREKILQIKTLLNSYPGLSLRIMGYSDRVGSLETNLKLAQSRAETVRNALITQGIDSKRLQALAAPTPPLGVDSQKPLWLARCVEFQPVVSQKNNK